MFDIMKQSQRFLWLLFAAVSLLCGVARGDDNRNRTLTVDPLNAGWKVTVTVPPGWEGKVARVKRPVLKDVDVYYASSEAAALARLNSRYAPPGDTVAAPGPDGNPVVLLWTPVKGKPACVIALGFFRVRDDDAKGKAPAPPAGAVKFKGKNGAGFYGVWPFGAGKFLEPGVGFGRVEAVKEARGVYYVKQWMVSFDVLVRDAKSAEEFAQALKIVREGIYVPWIIGTKAERK